MLLDGWDNQGYFCIVCQACQKKLTKKRYAVIINSAYIEDVIIIIIKLKELKARIVVWKYL